MSSHATEGAQSAEPAGESAPGAPVPAHQAWVRPADAEAAPPGALADAVEAVPAGPGEEADDDPLPADQIVSAVTGPAPSDLPLPDLTAADAGAMTLLLDPGPAPGPADQDLDEPVSKLAVVALLTSVVALIPVAVAFAISALVGIHRTGRRGRGMAMAALFACAAWVIVAGAIGTVAVLTHGFRKPVTIKYHEAAVFKLRTGDCVNSPYGQLVSVLPCANPHAAEVFATFSLPGKAWPGTTAVATEASSGCGDRLPGYLNPELAVSLTQSFVYPDKDAWAAGTRTVICEVRATSGELTGSVRGATL